MYHLFTLSVEAALAQATAMYFCVPMIIDIIASGRDYSMSYEQCGYDLCCDDERGLRARKERAAEGYVTTVDARPTQLPGVAGRDASHAPSCHSHTY